MQLCFYIVLSFYVQSQELADYMSHNYQLELTIKNKLQVKGKGKLDLLTSRYHYIPQSNPNQQVLLTEYFSCPKADTIIQSRHKFIWDRFYSNIEIGYKSILATKFHQYPITPSKITNKDFPDSLQAYLRFDQFVKVNEPIKHQIKSIVGNEEEQFIIAFKLGTWINSNIKYIKSGIKQPGTATSTFSSRFGDCDEISVLYIAMLRYAGIPARYVSGIANDNNSFSFHAWVEVYFEGVNWVPFDATYNQYGYIDQGHIKLNHGTSSSSVLSNYYEYYPHFGNITVHSTSPELNVKPVKSFTHKQHPIKIKFEAKHTVVSENSFLPIVIAIKNTTPYFLSNNIYIRQIQNIRIIGDIDECLLFYPNEEKHIKLMLKLDKVEDDKALYNASFKISDQFGENQGIDVSFRRFAKRITKDKAQKLLELYTISSSPKGRQVSK